MGSGRGSKKRMRANAPWVLKYPYEEDDASIIVAVDALLERVMLDRLDILEQQWKLLRHEANKKGKQLCLQGGSFSDPEARDCLLEMDLRGCLVDTVVFDGVDLTNGLNFGEHTLFENCAFKGCPSGANPRHLSLSGKGSYFIDCDLSRSSLLLNLKDAFLSGCNLSHSVIIAGSEIKDTVFSHSNLASTRVLQPQLRRVDFKRCPFGHAQFSGENDLIGDKHLLMDVSFEKCDCEDMELDDIILHAVEMTRCECSRSIWTDVELLSSKLQRTTFDDSSFLSVRVDGNTTIPGSAFGGCGFEHSDAWDKLTAAARVRAGTRSVPGLTRVGF